MTATLRERVQSPPPLPERRAVRGGQVAARPASDGLEVVATVALIAVTLVVTPGARGIMGHSGSLFPVVAVGLVTHLVPWGTRRLRIAAGPLITLAAYGLAVTWAALPETTFLGIPTTETLRAAIRGLGLGVRALDTRLDPGLMEATSVVQGRLLLAVVSVGACAFMADQAAFRIRNSFLALVPSLSILLLGATRAPAENRSLVLATYLVATLAFLLAHHAMATRASAAVVQGRQPAWGIRLLPGGVVLGVLAVAAALLGGPHIPGYGRPALVDIDSPTGTPTPSPDAGAVTLSPLVDVNPNLVQQSDTLMFTVASNEAAYWRLSSLDRFDGRVWSQGTAGADGGLADSLFSGSSVVQEFEIKALRGDWLPAAYRPRLVDESVARIDRSNSYSLRSAGTVRAGLRYRVSSLLPRPAPPSLLATPVAASGPAATPYLELPSDLSRRVVEEARRIVSGSRARGPYEMALVLQAHFRENFTYDLDVRPGHGEDALVRFLFRTRRGYCEQFSAAYAVMARAVGLPARVAVGFTPGEMGDDGRYQVRGLNAHSWPEVYFQGVGWVAFEPTPGRGMPGAEDYTGVTPDQARFTPSPVTPTTAPSTPVPTVAPTDSTVTTAPEVGPTTDVPSSDEVATTVGPAASSGSGPAVAVVAGMIAALASVAAMPLLRGVRRRRRLRRSGANGPNDLVVLAWADAVEALVVAGLGRRPAETMLAHARRASEDNRLPPGLAEPVLVLAGRAGTAAYSSHEIEHAVAEEAGHHAAVIRAGLRRATPLPRRLTRVLFH